jgi:small subunit ribosomal protein S17
MADNTEQQAEAQAEAQAQAHAQADTGQVRGRRQVKVGRVVSDKMNKTVVVAVPNAVTHRLYHRTIKRTSKFHAHDEENQCRVGDLVEIVSSRPLSKTKRWRVRQVVERAQ